MAGKSALRADTNALESFFSALAVALGNKVGGLVHPVDHFLLVLELGELGGDHTEDYVLVLGEVLQGLEAAGTGSVVFEVVGVDVQVLREVSGGVLPRSSIVSKLSRVINIRLCFLCFLFVCFLLFLLTWKSFLAMLSYAPSEKWRLPM